MYLSYRGVFFFWLDAMTPPLSRGRLQQKIIPKALGSEHLLTANSRNRSILRVPLDKSLSKLD